MMWFPQGFFQALFALAIVGVLAIMSLGGWLVYFLLTHLSVSIT